MVDITRNAWEAIRNIIRTQGFIASLLSIWCMANLDLSIYNLVALGHVGITAYKGGSS